MRPLEPFIERYGERTEDEPERLTDALIHERVSSGFTLLRELHDLWLLVNESLIAIRALKQPERRITLLTSPAGAEIAALVPEIDEIIVYEAPWMKATPFCSFGRRQS